MNKDNILQRLKEFRENDLPWREGRLWSYVYYLDKETEEIGKVAYMEYLTENGIDTTAFSSLRLMENEVMGFCRELLRGGTEAVGTMTTGGTESILLAVKTARDRAKALNPLQEEFEMVLPETVHAAFYKAAHYFGVKAVTVKVDDESLKATADLIKPYLNENTILVAASAVSYAYGILDDIEEIGALAEEKNIPFHVDGCIGAFILSAARVGGMQLPDFDFSVPGVTSISMDLHKYAYCPKGASVLLFKNDEYRKYQFFVCNEWTGYTFANTGILSSKTGGPIAAAWAVTHHIGAGRYSEVSLETIRIAREIRKELEKNPHVKVLANPLFSLLSFTTPGINIYALSDELKSRKWHAGLQLQHRHIPANIHLTVAAHHFNNYQLFLKDLFEAIEVVKEKNIPLLEPDLSLLAAGNIEAILAEAGVTAEGLPDELAGVNQLLEKLPKEVTKEMLLNFMQGLYKI